MVCSANFALYGDLSGRVVEVLRTMFPSVDVYTNSFKPDAKQYHPSRAMNLIAPSSDTRTIFGVAQSLLRGMWRKGYRWKKAGVGLLDLVHGDAAQPDLFTQVDPRSAKLMDVLDRSNRKFGRGTMGFAASGWKPKPAWGMRQEHLSQGSPRDGISS